MTTQDIVTELSERVTTALAKRDAEITFLRQALTDTISALEACAPDGMSTEQIEQMVFTMKLFRFDAAVAQDRRETAAQQVIRELQRVDASEGARIYPAILCEHEFGSPVDPFNSYCLKCGAQKVVYATDYLATSGEQRSTIKVPRDKKRAMTDVVDKVTKLAFEYGSQEPAPVATNLDARLANAAPGEAVEITQEEFATLKARPQKIDFREYGSQEPARAMTDEDIAEIYTPKGPATFCTCDALHVCDNCKRLEAKMVLPIPASQSGACVAPVAEVCPMCKGVGGVDNMVDGYIESSEPCPECRPQIVDPCTMHGHEFTPLNEFNETPLCEVCGGTYPTEIAK